MGYATKDKGFLNNSEFVQVCTTLADEDIT